MKSPHPLLMFAASCVMVLVAACTMPVPSHQVATHDHAHALGAARSSGWPKVRDAYMAAHPKCEACGQPSEEAHHVSPFAHDPSKELDPNNLIALCRHDHLLIGHADSWRTYNPRVREDAAKLLAMLAEIKAKRLENKP